MDDDKDKRGWQYEGGGTKVSVYLEVAVQRAAQERARDLGRSVSWIVNRSLRRELGLVTDESGTEHT